MSLHVGFVNTSIFVAIGKPAGGTQLDPRQPPRPVGHPHPWHGWIWSAAGGSCRVRAHDLATAGA